MGGGSSLVTLMADCDAAARPQRGQRYLQLLLLLGGSSSGSFSFAQQIRQQSNPLVQSNAATSGLTDGNPNVIARLAQPQDCLYFGWGTWSPCVGQSTFNKPTGLHTRTRQVRSPEKGTSGKPCIGPMFDAALCLTSGGSSGSKAYLTGAVGTGADRADPTTLTPCSLSQWGTWSGCMTPQDPSNAGTQSCGYSYETRTRQLMNPPCILSDKVRNAFRDCGVDSVQNVRGCTSRVSDRGSILESRQCPIGVCNTPCVVAQWTPYGACSQTCGTGVQRRKRTRTQSAGGSGTPCPRLVEPRNCRVAECDADCKVGAFGPWGRCMSVANTVSQVSVAVPGKSPSSSCARKRTRQVLIKRAGIGSPCPSLQEFRNCRCPLGAPVARIGLSSNNSNSNTTQSPQPTNQWYWPQWAQSAWKNMKRNWKSVGGKQGSLGKLGVPSWVLAIAIPVVSLCLAAVCICGCCYMCCRCCRSRKTRKVVTYDKDGDDDAGLVPRGQRRSGSRNHPSGAAQRLTRTLSPSDMPPDREPNEEGARDDEPLLSERPEPHYASTKARMLAAGKSWQREPSRSTAATPTPGSWADPTMGSWADPSRPYGGMPSAPNGYPGMSNYGGPYANSLSYGSSPLDYPPAPPLLPPPPPQYSQLQAGNAMRPF